MHIYSKIWRKIRDFVCLETLFVMKASNSCSESARNRSGDLEIGLYTLRSAWIRSHVCVFFYWSQNVVRFHQVGAPRGGFWWYLTEIGSLFLWTFVARISKVLRVRSPEARRWNGHSLHFPTPYIELQNVEIKLVCAYQTFRLLLGQVKIIIIEKYQN